jgi:hypothetical protein
MICRMAEGVVAMSTRVIVFASLLSLALCASASAEVLITTPPPATTRTDAFFVGAGFYANASGTATVNALGYWDEAGDGLAVSHEVALLHFNGADQTIVAKVTVPAGTVAPLVDGYRWVTIPTYTLADASQGADYYTIAAVMGTDAWFDIPAGSQTSNSSIGTLTGHAAFIDGGTPVVGAVGSTLTAYFNTALSYHGANVGMVSIPEPSSLMLLVCGLFGLVAYAWRKRR